MFEIFTKIADWSIAQMGLSRAGNLWLFIAAAEAPQGSAILECSGGYKFPPLCWNGALHL